MREYLMFLQLKEEISALKDQIFSLKTELLEIQNRFPASKTENELSEDAGAIDDILLKQSPSFESKKCFFPKI